MNLSRPMMTDDGFDYTENFDGKQVFGRNIVYINLKCVVGVGDSQTRTLRDECYPFVEAQLNYVLNSGNQNTYFANIFDGDEASSKLRLFDYLLRRPEYMNVKKFVYVGELANYFNWLSENVLQLNEE